MEDMNARVVPIGEIFSGSGGKRYYIPPYQRPYKWNEDDAEQLVQDIYESCKAKDEKYFIGSIICFKKNKMFEVVDGQQRLVTLTLIMLQLKKSIKDEIIKGELERKIVRTPIFNKNKNSFFPILKVRESELDFYFALLRQEDNDIPPKTKTEKRFMTNLKKIEKFMLEMEMEQNDLEDLAQYLLECVFVVFVEVDNLASSFRLFNVLNNRGMPLSDADLVKNVLLEKAADNKENSEKVERQWQEIENIVGEENINNFLSLHQISEKKDRNRVKKKNFEHYEKRLKSEEFQNDSVKMSKMLLHSAKFYKEIWDENKEAKKIISFLKASSKPDEWMPAFMAFLSKKHKNFPLFAEFFEKVYMHRLLSDGSASKRKEVCYYAVDAINNNKSFDEIIACIRGLEKNQQFEESLDNTKFYDKSRPRIINLVKSVLLRLESERHDGSIENKPNFRNITVEHILPQNRENPYWTTSRFTKEQHDEWLHKLGNLTILSHEKNSAAKNLGFDDKKKAYERLNQKSPFEITKELCSLPEWNMEALQNRHERLKKELKDLWLVDEEIL